MTVPALKPITAEEVAGLFKKARRPRSWIPDPPVCARLADYLNIVLGDVTGHRFASGRYRTIFIDDPLDQEETRNERWRHQAIKEAQTDFERALREEIDELRECQARYAREREADPDAHPWEFCTEHYYAEELEDLIETIREASHLWSHREPETQWHRVAAAIRAEILRLWPSTKKPPGFGRDSQCTSVILYALQRSMPNALPPSINENTISVEFERRRRGSRLGRVRQSRARA